MCIIICKEAGVALPLEATLRTCANKNKDGVGVAYTDNGHVKIKKDFADVEAFIDFANACIPIDRAAIIHFRIATQGRVDSGNRHPFPLSRKTKRLRALECKTDYAVAHNGTLSQIADHQKFSDTLLFIQNILADPVIRNNLSKPVIQKLVKSYLGTSRLAILAKDGSIVRFGEFNEATGLYYSNYGYKDYGTNAEYYHDSRGVGFGGCMNYYSGARYDTQEDSIQIQCRVCQKWDWSGWMKSSYETTELPICFKCNREVSLEKLSSYGGRVKCFICLQWDWPIKMVTTVNNEDKNVYVCDKCIGSEGSSIKKALINIDKLRERALEEKNSNANQPKGDDNA